MIISNQTRIAGSPVIITPSAISANTFRMGGFGQVLDQLIKSLFANNEQGFVYDPNDLSTLFQDSAGTTPVTAAGQPVGLILDKSKGLALGNELITNGSFSNGVTGWSPEGVTQLVSDGQLEITVATTPNASTQIIPTVIGKTYLFTCDVKAHPSNTTANSARMRIERSPIYRAAVTANGIKQKLQVVYTATSTSTLIELQIASHSAFGVAGEKAYFANISAKELVGNHAYQTTSSSRPVLRKNAETGSNYLEFDGTDDSLRTNSIDFSSTDKVSLFAGVRKLSDVTAGTVVEFSSVITNPGSFALQAPSGPSNYSARVSGNSSLIGNAVQTGYSGPHSAVLTSSINLGASDNKKVSLRVNSSGTAYNSEPVSSGMLGNYPLYIGRRNGITITFTGHIYGLIGIGKLTTDAETAIIEKELAKRTGATLNV